jgi:hypothetical protein
LLLPPLTENVGDATESINRSVSQYLIFHRHIIAS